MKVREIVLLDKGRERRFRGPRVPRNIQIGFHKRMKKLLDKAINEDDGARIHHLEDFFECCSHIIDDNEINIQDILAILEIILDD